MEQGGQLEKRGGACTEGRGLEGHAEEWEELASVYQRDCRRPLLQYQEAGSSGHELSLQPLVSLTLPHRPSPASDISPGKAKGPQLSN